jgi:hypothetical protein
MLSDLRSATESRPLVGPVRVVAAAVVVVGAGGGPPGRVGDGARQPLPRIRLVVVTLTGSAGQFGLHGAGWAAPWPTACEVGC